MERTVALVVEQNEALRLLISAVVGEMGFKVKSASGAGDGYAKMKGHPTPNIILIDKSADLGTCYAESLLGYAPEETVVVDTNSLGGRWVLSGDNIQRALETLKRDLRRDLEEHPLHRS